MIKLSYIYSDDRKYNIQRCLSLIKTEVVAGLKNAKSVVIKPNCVVTDNQLAATHVDALDTILDFIRPFTKSQIILAEGTGIGKTIDALKNYGYLSLQDKYDMEIRDLNTDEAETIELMDRNQNPMKVKISKTIIDADYIISVTPPKTHNEVVYIGAIKNIAIGSLVRPYDATSRIKPLGKILNRVNYKELIHQGSKAMNENIANIFRKLQVGLAVIDGFVTMQGNGPIDGEMVPTHFAIASTNAVAADWLATQCLGMNIEDIGYLSLLEATQNSQNYFVAGDDWQHNITDIKMHPNFDKIKHWQ